MTDSQIPGHRGHKMSALTDEEFVPKEFNDANIRVAREFKAQRDALVKALEDIAAMDPKGTRADDLGRAPRIAADGIKALVGTPLTPAAHEEGGR